MPVNMNDFLEFIQNELGEEVWVPLYKNLNKEDQSEDGSLFSCLISPENTSKAMDESSWDLIPGSGGPSIVWSGKDNIWYEPNSSEHLPLIICRDFPGRRKPYREILQELVLYLNLYHDQDNSKYIIDDDNGVEIKVIKYSDTEILIRKSFLTAFMSARQMNLLLFFENTRHKNTNEPFIDEEVNKPNISFTRYEGGSYVDGFNTFTRVLGKKLFCCNPREEEHFSPFKLKNKYESFIIKGDAHDNTLHSCDPSLLADNFGNNEGSPYYLTPIYFKKTVLQKYFSSSTEYEVQDSAICKHGLWRLRFDNNSPGHTCVFLGDLGRDIPNSEQIYWKSFNIPPEGRKMSKTYFTRSMLGACSEPESPDLVFKSFFVGFQDRWLKSKGWNLFLPLVEADTHCFKALHSLNENEQSEFDSQILSLTKITVDSINVAELKKKIPTTVPNKESKDGAKKENKGSIKLLAEFLEIGGVSFDVVALLGGLQGLRSSGVAHRRGERYEGIIKRLGGDDGKLIEIFDKILEDMTLMLIEIEELFLKQQIDGENIT